MQPTQSIVSVEEIDQRMKRDGFPEMQRHWDRFRERRVTTESLCNTRIVQFRARHMAPFFGTWAVLFVLFLIGIYAGWSFSTTLPAFAGATVSVRIILCLWIALNYTFLLAYIGTLLQRHFVYPMERIIGEDLAFMLSRGDFRAFLEYESESRTFHKRRQSLDVNDFWDSHSYHQYYHASGGTIKRLGPVSCADAVQETLREFLGSKDIVQRKHQPGRLMHHLREGKKSVSAFVSLYGKEIRANAERQLSPDQSIGLLRKLRRDFLQNGLVADQLDQKIKAFERGDFLPENSVCAQIWKRDPWQDLTHQEEFYSSASLRGVKLVGRGNKGRLGTFGYLRNRSISALDFSRNGRRFVRARIGLVELQTLHGTAIPTLFVDGVEGSNAIAMEIVRTAIEDYASSCNLPYVVYHAGVHNQIPRRFVRYLEHECGLSCRELQINYLENSTREYLDAFGFPFEPFEYAYPKGRVLGLVARIHGGRTADDQIGTSPTGAALRLRWLRRNSIWVLFGETFTFAGYTMWQTVPALLIGLVLLGFAGTSIQLWHQGRSLRVTLAERKRQ